jgi:hypothetical protein
MPKKASHPRKNGRPTKLTPTTIAKLKEAFAYGLNDDQAAALVGVSDVTLTLWKRKPAFIAEIRGAITERLLVRLKRIEEGTMAGRVVAGFSSVCYRANGPSLRY